MALEFFTGFEGCGSTADIKTLFTTDALSAYNASNGYANGKCVSITSTSYWGQKSCTAAKTKACGHHRKNAGIFNTINDSTKCLVRFIGPDIHVYNTSVGLKVTRGVSTVIATIGSGTEITAQITHIQVKLFSDASAGTIEIWIDGVLFGSATGLNTGGQDITVIYWGSTNAACYIDNLYISDVIEGELISQLCKPSADSAVQFTPSTGSDNYALVDEAAQDGDTTYVESSTVGHQDLYTYEDVPSGYLVKGVSVVTVAKKDDPGSRTLQIRGKQDATEYNIGSELVLSTTYPAVVNTAKIDILPLAPDGTAWTLAKFNACTWGFKVAS